MDARVEKRFKHIEEQLAHIIARLDALVTFHRKQSENDLFYEALSANIKIKEKRGNGKG